MIEPDKARLEVFKACVENARALVDSAKAVQAIGKHNIAYHLATLSLEEMGKRELLQIQDAARPSLKDDPPQWQIDATQDHVRKLFWCLYSLGTIPDSIDQRLFFEKRDAAADIHANRLAGLYVDASDGRLNVPALAISPRQAAAIVDLADMMVSRGESEQPRDAIPDEERELQIWFLNATDDPEGRQRIFTKQTLERLKTLNDVPAWTRELKAKLEAEAADLTALAQRELARPAVSDASQIKERWKIRIRIETHSNSIRPAFLKEWNGKVDWIKMSPIQGKHNKDQLQVEFVLRNDVPVPALWPLGFTLSLRMIIALNLATSGFWWWRSSPNRIKYYEAIVDIDNPGHGLEIEPQDLQVFERRAPLTPVHAETLIACLTTLPDDPRDSTRGASYTAYLGGLNFLALNSPPWRTESWAFGQFFQAFRGLASEALYLQPDEPISAAIGRFTDEKFPPLDQNDRAQLIELSQAVEVGTEHSVKPGDVYFLKLLCETLFRDNIVPTILRQHRKTNSSDAR